MKLDCHIILVTKTDFLAYKKILSVGNAQHKMNYSGTYKPTPI